MVRGPLSPDDATKVEQIRPFLDLLIGAAALGAVAEAAAGLIFDSPRALAASVLFGSFAALVTWLRRTMRTGPVGPIVMKVAAALTALMIAVALLQPFAALATAIGLFIPVAVALPYVQARALRRLNLIAWGAIILVATAEVLPDDAALPASVKQLIQILGVTLASGVVLFLLTQSSERLKDGGREFLRLFQLTTDLANTTEPGVLGELVARHLAEATGFEECVIYALAPETGQLAPFGSYPPERALTLDQSTVADRVSLGHVVHDGVRLIVDASAERKGSADLAYLHKLDRRRMLLLPLVARGDPVGVVELTGKGHEAVDERRLALAQTLAFEAALAIENGRLYQELRYRSLHDPLTGLANRSLFSDRVEHALSRLSRQSTSIVGLLFVDLDHFKNVNDSIGHAAGDELLKLTAGRLRSAVRPADTVARLGGDEFALLLEDLASDDQAMTIGKRVVEVMQAPFTVAGQQITTSVSIGVAVRTGPRGTVDELVQDADAAMYEAKRSGRGRAVRYQARLDEASAQAITRDPKRADLP